MIISKRNRNAQIEAIRVFCCLAVFLFHVTVRYYDVFGEGFNYGLNSLFRSLVVIAVQIFMILSILFYDGKTFGELISRIFKLWVPFALSTLLISIIVKLVNLESRTVDIKDLICNLTMLPNLFGARYVDGAHWYLESIVILFLIITLIKNLINNNMGYSIWLLLAIASRYIGRGSYILQIDYCGLAVLVISLKEHLSGNKEKIILFNIVMSLIEVLIVQGSGYLIFLLISILIVYLCYYRKLHFLEHNIFINIGTYTYCFYLLHQNISFCVIYYLAKKSGEYNYYYICVAFFLVFGLTYLLKKISSKVFIIIKSRFEKIM